MKLFNNSKLYNSIKFNALSNLPKKSKFRLLLIVILAYIISLIIITISTQLDLPFPGIDINNFKLNEFAKEDLYVTRGIQYTDVKATQQRKEAVMKTILPIFRMNDEITKECIEQFKIFASIIKNGVDNKVSKDLVINQLQIQIPKIYESIKEQDLVGFMSIAHRQPEILDIIQTILEEVVNTGVFQGLDNLLASEPDLFIQGKIEHYLTDSRVVTVPMDNVLTVNNLDAWLEERISRENIPGSVRQIVRAFTKPFIRENSFFDRQRTEENKRIVSDLVLPIKKTLSENQNIIRKGNLVTEDILNQIKALNASDFSFNIFSLVGNAVFLAGTFLLALFMFSKSFGNSRFTKNQVYLLVAFELLFLIICTVLYRIPWEKNWIPFSVMIPTGIFCILLTLLISVNTGFTFAFTSALLVLLIGRMDLSPMIFSFLSGVFGTYVAMKAENRIDLIWGGMYLALSNSLVLIALIFLMNMSFDMIFWAIFFGSINGFMCGVLSEGFLPLLEMLLNSATRFRLMELSDLNSPIFKKMLTLAPGTYNHSIMVANLAESACTEINANSLLARAGAYYHDIGKIDQAEYFIENQRTNNKHDDLKPSLSVAVIKSHVKIGIEKAKELNLPKDLIDIIEQHHGKGLIAYFYHRAITKDTRVSPEDFSYPGERPRTKEAAVVMLADIVEASTRALKRPTLGKIEKLVWSIIMDRFTAGELSKCPLTLSDLEVIKRSFVQILSGYFHTRIEYPKQVDKDKEKNREKDKEKDKEKVKEPAVEKKQ